MLQVAFPDVRERHESEHPNQGLTCVKVGKMIRRGTTEVIMFRVAVLALIIAIALATAAPPARATCCAAASGLTEESCCCCHKPVTQLSCCRNAQTACSCSVGQHLPAIPRDEQRVPGEVLQVQSSDSRADSRCDCDGTVARTVLQSSLLSSCPRLHPQAVLCRWLI